MLIQAQPLAGLTADTGKEHGHVSLVEAVQGPPQGIVVQVLGQNARTDQAFGGLVHEELGGQVEGLIGKAQAVEDHRFHGLADRHLALGVILGDLPVYNFTDPQFIDHCGHQA